MILISINFTPHSFILEICRRWLYCTRRSKQLIGSDNVVNVGERWYNAMPRQYCRRPRHVEFTAYDAASALLYTNWGRSNQMQWRHLIIKRSLSDGIAII